MAAIRARVQPVAATVRGLSDEQIGMIHDWVADLKTALAACATVADPVLLEEPGEASRLERELRAGTDAFLIVPGGWSTGGMWEFASGVRPAIFPRVPNWRDLHWSGPRTIRPTDPDMGPRQWHVAGALRAEGREVYTPVTHRRLEDICWALAARQWIGEANVLHIGPLRFDGYAMCGCADPVRVRRRLGARLVEVSPGELRELVEEVPGDAADDVADRWLQITDPQGRPETEDLVAVARMYLALRRLIQLYDASALTTTTCRLVPDQTPCFALAALMDDGIPATCQSDIGAVLTMMMVQGVADRASLAGDIWFNDAESNRVVISHDPMPGRVHGLSEEPVPCVFHRFHGPAKGLAAFRPIEPGGPATLARLGRRLEALTLQTGTLVGCHDELYCQESLEIEVPDAEGLAERLLGTHVLAVCGDHERRMRTLAAMLGIEVV
jgi:L-fucose isomerase-like protein